MRQRPMITGRGGPPKQPPPPRAPVEAPNTLRSRAIVRGVFLRGEGVISGSATPSNGQKSIYLDGVPLVNPDGTYNFNVISVDERNGTPDQTYMPGFPAIETEVAVGANVVFATPVVRAISDTSATSVRVTVTVPSLVSVDPNTGDQSPAQVSIAIDVQPNGGSYVNVLNDTFTGKTVSAYQRAWRINNLPAYGAGPWNIRVRRTTADSVSSNLLNATQWASYTVIRDYRFAYPDSALLGLILDAEAANGRLPRVQEDLRGVNVEIPSNYNPTTRAYTGVWDGTFTTAYTDNPVWLFYALLTNERWGLGHFIRADQVDKWALYDIAQWCDELVPDGFGGTEPRHRFNGVLDTTDDAFRVLTLLAGSFNCLIYWGSGTVTLVADRPTDPVMLITPSNVVGGTFTYSGSDIGTRPTAAYVAWRDPAQGYERTVEVYEDPVLISARGLRVNEPVGYGYTTRGQAHRRARYEVETAWSETESASWTAGWDQADLAPGDIVEIADPSVQTLRMGGRIVAASGTSVTLDGSVAIDGVSDYTLKCIDPTGAMQERAVVMPAGAATVLTIASAFSPEPMDGAVWLLESTSLAPRRFRIIERDPTGSEIGQWKFNAILHDPNKQARIEDDIVLEAPPFTAFPTGVIEAPSGLGHIETIVQLAGGTYRHLVTLSWAPTADPRVVRYDIDYRLAGEDTWTEAGESSQPTVELRELGDGEFEFRVRAIGFDGRPSPYSTTYSTALVGLTGAPEDVEDVAISVIADVATLSWSPVGAPNLSHYEVRFSPDASTVDWQSAVVLQLRVSGTSVQIPSRPGAYLVKAVTAQGVYSVNPGIVVSDVAAILQLNAVEVLIGQPDWDGTFHQVKVDTDRQALRLSQSSDWFDRSDFFDWTDWFGPDGTYDSGVFTFGDTVDLGEVYTSRVSALIEAFGERTTDDVWALENVWSLDNIFGAEPGGWDVWLEIRTTNDDPGGSPVWTDWRTFIVSDITARAFQFRVQLTTTDPFVTPIVERVEITIDMPDRVIAGDDIVVPIAGLRVDFVPAFKSYLGLGVAEQDLDTGDYAVITNKDATGFDIIFRNSAGTAVERTFDYVAKGYGKVQT